MQKITSENLRKFTVALAATYKRFPKPLFRVNSGPLVKVRPKIAYDGKPASVRAGYDIITTGLAPAGVAEGGQEAEAARRYSATDGERLSKVAGFADTRPEWWWDGRAAPPPLTMESAAEAVSEPSVLD